jgi:hypothetical protein
MAMQTDPKVYAKQPVNLVITRSCKSRTKEGEPLKDYSVGQVVTFTHQFGDELVSVGKAMVADSPEGKEFIAKLSASKAKEEKPKK